MIDIKNKFNCCGCNACVSICPKDCISLVPDDEGFLFPVVQEDKCINCNLCEKACQYITINEVKEFAEKPKVYVAKNIDNKEILKSSSGGAFSVLAEAVIKDGGTVFGALYNENMLVIHSSADTLEDMYVFRGSKYVQSDINTTYIEAKKLLIEGKKVFFTGTPCQIGGLYSFLGRDYDRLITADIICFGVPSPKIFANYVDLLNEKYKSKVTNIDFRDKSSGWLRSSTKIEFQDSSIKYLKKSNENEYYNIFHSHNATRLSCHNCLYTNLKRKSDISLGDFWGIEKIKPEIDNKVGVSKILINTEKGQELFNKVIDKFEYYEMPTETAIRVNLKSPPPISKDREKFMEDYKSRGFNYVSKRLMRKVILKNYKNKVVGKIKAVIKKVVYRK